jgi:hypothetical protein
MLFTRVTSPVEAMEAWNASGNGFTFVITHESPGGPGFRGRSGFMASWRPIQQNSSATEIAGSPFDTLSEAQSACKAVAILSVKSGSTARRGANINFDVQAVLRKWPSLGNERRIASTPYLLVEATLDECLKGLMAKPASARRLYEIQIAPEDELLSAVLPERLVSELMQRRSFSF